MPISVSCPACSASFKVKDEFAGKRAKCPKCGGPIVVPAASAGFEFVGDEPAPTPVRAKPIAAKPVVAAKPRPVEDDEDDHPKHKRGASNEDEDDAPEGKKRWTAADDDEVDWQQKKRRRDDDEPKKKSALPLILGIVAGALLVGGGIAVAVVLMQNPGQAKATNTMPTVPPIGGGPLVNANVTQANAERIKAGMTSKDLGAIFGQGYMAVNRAEVGRTLQFLRGAQSESAERWLSAADESRVVVWTNGEDLVAIAYTTKLGINGEVQGVMGRFGGVALEYVRLPPPQSIPPGTGGITPGGPNPTTGGIPVGQPVATLTPDQLIRDAKKYEGRYVVVSGMAEDDLAKGELVLNLALQKTDAKRIDYFFGFTKYMPVEVKKGQKVELWGKVDKGSSDSLVRLWDVEFLNPTPDLKLSEVIDAYLKDEAAASKKYSGSRWRFTGKATSKTEFGLWVLEERPGTPPVQVEVNLEEGETDSVSVGNTITFYASMPAVGLRREKDSVKFNLTAARLAPTSRPPGPK